MEYPSIRIVHCRHLKPVLKSFIILYSICELLIKVTNIFKSTLFFAIEQSGAHER